VVLLPPPSRRVPLMLGAHGARMLSIALPHVDIWNTWFEQYGNDPARFAELNARIDYAAEQARRDPADIERSACLLVEVDASAAERVGDPDAPPIPFDRLGEALDELAAAGADEAILVATPITEESIRILGRVI
jgi:alkanesulfonate monooxygenase SsuD/methylene tetrahydromethanopterin reductase-like flavin-dependent oxidoreductase (luciferase family)